MTSPWTTTEDRSGWPLAKPGLWRFSNSTFAQIQPAAGITFEVSSTRTVQSWVGGIGRVWHSESGILKEFAPDQAVERLGIVSSLNRSRDGSLWVSGHKALGRFIGHDLKT